MFGMTQQGGCCGGQGACGCGGNCKCGKNVKPAEQLDLKDESGKTVATVIADGDSFVFTAN